MLKYHHARAYLVAFASAAAILVTTGILAHSESSRFQAQERATVLNQLSTVRAKLEGYINSQLLLAEALAAYTATNPAVTQAEFSQTARVLMAKNGGIRSLNLAENSVISHIFPLAGNERAVGLNLVATPQQREAVARTIRERRSIVAGPVKLVQGGVAFINRTPIFVAEADGASGDLAAPYWGLASVLVAAEAVYQAGRLPDQSKSLNLALRGKDGLGDRGEVFWGEAAVFQQNPVLLSVTIPNGSWQLAALPKAGWRSNSALAVWIWLSGSAIAILSMGLMFTLVSTPDRLRMAVHRATADLKAALTQLQQEMTERKRLEVDRQIAEIALRESQVKLAHTQAELDITRRLQQMLLPQEAELQAIENLEIAGFMEPAAEVGGDYYDVLSQNGRVKIGIGDVTGHGLESGMVMVMVQMAVRTLLANHETNPARFLNAINQAVYSNVQRMQVYKNLTLTLLDYHQGILSLTGQHEELILIRAEGQIERIDTIDLGFPIGLEADISDFIHEAKVQLHTGDVVVLYTDGITEAQNDRQQLYGLDRLCTVAQAQRQRSAADIRHAIIADVKHHIGQQKVYDDITLLILKQQ